MTRREIKYEALDWISLELDGLLSIRDIPEGQSEADFESVNAEIKREVVKIGARCEKYRATNDHR
jgi:hypothetical protein